jgi:uncharacterized phage infection (PIP) family protein YhgE
VWKKYKSYIISCSISFIIGIGVIWAISSTISSRKIEQLTNTINAGKIINTKLQDTNTKLTEANTRLIGENNTATESIGRLEKQIADGNQYYQSELGKIKNGFTAISEGLGTISEGLSGDDEKLSNAIQTIESVKSFISSLKFN